MRPAVIYWTTCLLAAVLTACSGDGTIPPPAIGAPVITAVTPTSGEAGTRVRFSATSSGSPTSWEWEFGHGAAPASSTDPSPLVDLLTPGAYSATVSAANAQGESLPFTFEYTVTPVVTPRISHVNPTGIAGSLGESVLFSAGAFGDPSEWEWDFGGAASPGNSNSATPEVTLTTRGQFTGRVSAANDFGTGPTHEFPLWVTKVPSWQLSDIGAQVKNSSALSALVYRDRLVIGFIAFASQLPMVARAKTSWPSGPDDWAMHGLTDTGRHGDIVLAEIDGRLTAVFNGHAYGASMRYGTAVVAEPASLFDWEISNIDVGDIGWGNCLQEFEGRAALAFTRSNQRAWYARAHSSRPASSTDWTLVPITPTPGTGSSCTLILVDGRPAIPFTSSDRRSLNFAVATQSAPEYSEHFLMHTVIEDAYVVDYPAALVLNQQIFIAVSMRSRMTLFQAMVPVPQSPSDWTFLELGDGRRAPRIAAIDQRLFVSWRGDDHTTRLARAPLEDPVASPWEMDILPGKPFYGGAPAVELNGEFAVFFAVETEAGPRDLRLARSGHLW